MTRSPLALLSLFLLSFSTQACVATEDGTDGTERTGSQASAIQNGTEVNPANTGMVMLSQSNRLCSATLLDNRFLLTAAHCVESYANRTFAGGDIFVGNNTGAARGVAVDSKGRIVVGVTVSSENKIVLARFLADGTADATFGDAGLREQGTAGPAEVADIAVDARDRIVVASTLTLNNNRQIATWRFSEAGMMDWDFGLVQVTDFASSPDEVAKAVRIDALNRIVVAAEAKTANGGLPLIALVRYLPNGSLDTTFDGDGKVLTDLSSKGSSPWTFGGMSIDAYNRTVIAGTAGANIAVVRYNNNGSLDSTLSGDGVAYVRPTNMTMARAVSVASDAQNRIILTGSATSSTAESYALVGRLKSDGAPDTSFSGDGWVSYKHVWGNLVNTRVAVDPQGGIIATGVISGSRIGATRFTATGTYDTKFGMGGIIDWLASESTNPHAAAVAFDKSGHMFIAGDTQLASSPFFPRVWSLTLDHDVVPGWSSLTATMGNQTAKAETIYRHGPLDVALVKLATPLSMNGDAAHFEFQGFWPESILSLRGRSLHCYGYGNSDDVTGTGSGTLRTGIVPVSTTGLLDYTLVPNAEGQIPVHGDSGGACFATDSTGSWRLTGVTSWGTGGADPMAFTLHQVAAPVFSDWVRSIRLR
jgi:uncharacterized delta-60 repeat protein